MSETNVKERYSFSKLSSFHTCKYGYKLTYIDKQKGIGNAFASYGTEIHSLMERYAKGEIELWDLASTFEWEFDAAVPEKFPWNKYVDLHDSYYKQGIDFLNSFSGYEGLQLLGVEDDFDLEIDDWIFNGIVDLIFIDKDGKLIIRDYKSKASFKNAEEQKEYARQLYLYAMHVKDKFGKYPDELQFLMFRKQKTVKIPFDLDALNEAVAWAKDTVKEIRECFDYPPSCDDFYSKNLCNHREYCDLKI